MMRRRFSITRLLLVLTAAAVVAFTHLVLAADPAPEVNLNALSATPRSVEPLTQRSIIRDYKFAWTNLDQALQANSTDPLNSLFAGTAKTWLEQKVDGQSRAGITSRYANQKHKLEAVFYAPEGDVIELHDTAEYDYQILHGSDVIYNQHGTAYYVVLMTPGADRWVIRQLQVVPKF